jgi:ribonuclease HII|tara:strand:- start:967 stop:1572 length:606 start_codon:yes stop_codon:yes gene_type:complete
MLQYHTKDNLEIGIDEAGRGSFFGPVCVAAVIWPNEEPDDTMVIRDSKKLSEKKRNILREYIEENAIAYSVKFIDNDVIDKINILKATMKGMHECIDDIRKTIEIDTLLIDGNQFDIYMDHNFECINHHCVVGGDDKYKCIAAASILAKTYHDEYITDLVKNNPSLEQYGLLTNKGYGTKVHREAIKDFGLTTYHRKSFKI